MNLDGCGSTGPVVASRTDGAKVSWTRKERGDKGKGWLRCRLLVGVVLLLEAANLVHIERVELALGLLFVRGQLLLLHGLETDGGVLADADNEDAAVLVLAVGVLLVGEGDMDLGDVVGGVGRRLGAAKHRVAVTVDDEDGGAAVVGGLDGEAAVVVDAFGVVVRGQELGLHAALADTTDEPEAGDEDGGEEDEAEDKERQIKHPLVVGTLGFGGDDGVAGKQGVAGSDFLVEGRADEGAADVFDGGHGGQ
jgi:hypothetical protein